MALLFSYFFPACFIADVSVCVICDCSIVATCPSIPAAHFTFCLCFNQFVYVDHNCFICFVFFGEPKQN